MVLKEEKVMHKETIQIFQLKKRYNRSRLPVNTKRESMSEIEQDGKEKGTLNKT